MSGSIRRIMEQAYRNVLSNPREAAFALKMLKTFKNKGNGRSMTAVADNSTHYRPRKKMT